MTAVIAFKFLNFYYIIVAYVTMWMLIYYIFCVFVCGVRKNLSRVVLFVTSRQVPGTDFEFIRLE